jgi:hypothetical protein
MQYHQKIKVITSVVLGLKKWSEKVAIFLATMYK